MKKEGGDGEGRGEGDESKPTSNLVQFQNSPLLGEAPTWYSKQGQIHLCNCKCPQMVLQSLRGGQGEWEGREVRGKGWGEEGEGEGKREGQDFHNLLMTHATHNIHPLLTTRTSFLTSKMPTTPTRSCL